MSEPEEQNDYVGNTLQNIFDEQIKAIIYSFVILIALNIIFLLFGIIYIIFKFKSNILKKLIHYEILSFKYLGYIGSHIGIITFICLYFIFGVFKDKLHTPFVVYLLSYYIVFLLIYLLNKT
jgi:cellobiose-specific phosphotransferase system component IIC